MNEQWRPVVGYEDRYEVSDAGRVKGLQGRWGRGGMLKPNPSGKGYQVVGLYNATGETKTYVHRLVLITFVGEPLDGQTQCNHKNGDKTDNRLVNLEWVSPLENIRHAIGTLGHSPARSNPGETNGNSKLTEADVREIRRLLATGKYTQKEIGRKFGVSDYPIGAIARNCHWSSLK